MTLITRAQWGARAPKSRSIGHLNTMSTCHWNGPNVTVDGKFTWDHSKCASLVRGIQNFHMDTRGWSDIAYNFIECPHGYTFECRGLNVINAANGTNIGNHTSHAIMCLAGPDNPFSDNEKSGFSEAVRYVANQVGAPEGCRGHREWHTTACPGDERFKWVHEGLPITVLSPPITPPQPVKRKEDSMEAALLLVKIHYDNARGDGKGSYDVAKSDPGGWKYWVSTLLDAHDRGLSLKAVTDKLAEKLSVAA